MKNFKQTESITRRLTGIVSITALLFLSSSVGVYLFSRSTLDGLTTLYRVNQIYDVVRQANQIVLSQAEIMRKSTAADRRSLSLFRLTGEQTGRLFDRGIQLAEGKPDVLAQLKESREATEAYGRAALDVLSGRVEFRKGMLVASQLEMEALDLLARSQIALRFISDRTFEEVYAGRFRPLAAGAAFSVLFTLVSLLMGFDLRKRVTQAIGNLVQATKHVAEGDLNYVAPVLRHDEIGVVTNAFNIMTQTLRTTTVSRGYLENIIESMRDSVVVVDLEGRIRQTNEIARSTFGFERDDVITERWKTLSESSLSFSEGGVHENVTCWTVDGREIPVAIGISPLKEDGETHGFVCVIVDISERVAARKELEARHLELRNANKELEAFSYSVSHDLRAPLRGIDGFSQALVEDLGPDLDDQAKDHLRRIRTGVQKMGHLIDNMLELSKLSRKELKIDQVDLAPIARTIFEELRNQEPTRAVEWKIDEKLIVEADRDLITILLENLIGNAWKYTSKVEHPRIELGMQADGEHRTFFIRDNGAGFDMTYYPKLFGAFQRLHRDAEFPGTGVGLATVQRIVQRHGGRVWAESEVGKGATFYFALPSGAVATQERSLSV